MKKIFTTIKEWANRLGMWWMLHFRNTLVQQVEFDAYKVSFRRFTMDIETKSGNMKLRTMNMLYPIGFLYNALDNGDKKTIEWFCNETYQFVSLITTDKVLATDIKKCFDKYYKRMEVKAKLSAKVVTEQEENVDKAIINANIEVGKMTKKERKAHKESIRDVLNEKDNK